MAQSDEPAAGPTRRARVRARIGREISKLSPERTRGATWFEAKTVARIPWEWLVRANRLLEIVGRIATAAYALFIATLVFGANWKDLVQSAINSGEPVKGAVFLAVVIPTLIFVALHSLTGWGRWKVQRELWRRDVERLGALDPGQGGPAADER